MSNDFTPETQELIHKFLQQMLVIHPEMQMVTVIPTWSKKSDTSPGAIWLTRNPSGALSVFDLVRLVADITDLQSGLLPAIQRTVSKFDQQLADQIRQSQALADANKPPGDASDRPGTDQPPA